MEDGSIVPGTAGTPQGGVISPLLANLFLHYAFDMWMAREFPHIPFERYADDATFSGALPHGALLERTVTVKALRKRGHYGVRLRTALPPANWCCILRRRKSSIARM
jgi:hypothetical protein